MLPGSWQAIHFPKTLPTRLLNYLSQNFAQYRTQVDLPVITRTVYFPPFGMQEYFSFANPDSFPLISQFAYLYIISREPTIQAP